MSRSHFHRLTLALLVAATRTATGQTPAKTAAPVSLEVRSMVPNVVLHVHVTGSGGAKFGLSVWNGAPRTVAQEGDSGSGTTPLIVHISNTRGRIRLEVSPNETPIRVTLFGDTARLPKALGLGRTLDVVRDSLGNVHVSTAPPPSP